MCLDLIDPFLGAALNINHSFELSWKSVCLFRFISTQEVHFVRTKLWKREERGGSESNELPGQSCEHHMMFVFIYVEQIQVTVLELNVGWAHRLSRGVRHSRVQVIDGEMVGSRLRSFSHQEPTILDQTKEGIITTSLFRGESLVRCCRRRLKAVTALATMVTVDGRGGSPSLTTVAS